MRKQNNTAQVQIKVVDSPFEFIKGFRCETCESLKRKHRRLFKVSWTEKHQYNFTINFDLFVCEPCKIKFQLSELRNVHNPKSSTVKREIALTA